MLASAKLFTGIKAAPLTPALSLADIRQIVRTSGICVSLESISSKAIQNTELAEAWEVMQFRLKHLEHLLAEVNDIPEKKKRGVVRNPGSMTL
jgi:hypothetical protein